MKKALVLGGILMSLILSSCASSSHKARMDQREKVAGTAGLYCEWVNGEKHPDIDVEVNLQMARRCDSSKPFSLSTYKNSADQNGVMYCCGMAANEGRGSVSKKSAGPGVTPKPSAAPVSSPPNGETEIEVDK